MDRPLRVLYIDHTAKIGGGEIALFNLVRHLDPARVEPTVLLFEDGPLADRLSSTNTVQILPLDPAVASASKDSLGVGSLGKLKPVWLTLRQIVRVARFAKRMQADLIHTNSLKADIIGGIAGRLAGVPVLWHVRDRISPDYLPPTVVRIFRLLCRTIPDFVIANSKATLATIQLEHRRPSAAVGSGVDLGHRLHAPEEPGTSQLSLTPGVKRIGLVGRISPWKGQHVFLRAAAQVLTQFPHLRFEIIGAALFSEKQYEEDLHKLCETLGIGDLVTFTGFVQDVPARLEQLDIFVHASTTGEPFGQVIVEAMAARKPVVATNGGGVPEIVLPGVTGLLVPMGDATAMAEAITFLLEHPDQARAMGLAGRERVLAEFTIQKSAARVQDIYDDVLRRRHRTS